MAMNTSRAPIYNSALLRFISSFEIAPNNDLMLNTLDKEAEFVSRFYTPRLRVSELASFVLKDIKSNKIRPTAKNPSKDTFLYKVIHSRMKEKHNNLYQIAKIVLLEVFSIVYLVDYKNEYAQYLSESDLKQARSNVLYLLDAIAIDEEYDEIKDHLHQFNIDLGYIQGQIPVMRRDLSNG